MSNKVNKDITDTQQCQAGVIVIKKSDKSMDIIEKWYNVHTTLFTGLQVSDPQMLFLSRHICPEGKLEFSGVLIEDAEQYTYNPWGKN